VLLRHRPHRHPDGEIQLVIRALRGLLLVAAAIAAPAMAQPDTTRRIGATVADTQVAGYRFHALALQAPDSDRRYRLRVAIPERPAPPSGYPAVWLLDGHSALMDIDAATLQRVAQAASPPVIVFVAHDNDLRIDGDARAYDYTPRRPGGEDAQRDPLGSRRNGGADAFLDLLAGEARRQVAGLAPIDASRQALWGHSYGGVFVLHALFTRPDAFARYGAADPSLWWGDGRLLQEEAAALPWKGAPPTLHLWTGDAAAPRTATPGPSAPARDPAALDAMRKARASVPPDATETMAARQRARGVHVVWDTLPGLSHGQTLGASLPRFLNAVADSAP
jgi:predicted alpha/beta superfamily hydrolase